MSTPQPDPLDDLYEHLFKQLLHGDPEGLRTRLQGLSSEDRATLFRRFRPLLKALRRICKPTYMGRPEITLHELRRELTQEPDALIRRKPLPELYDADLFTRVQALHVGLAPERELKTGLDQGDVYVAASGGETGFVDGVGRILLDRPEPWMKPILVEWLLRVPLGLGLFMLEVQELYPDLNEALAPAWPRVMMVDGFCRPSFRRFPPAMILAGLSHDGWPDSSTYDIPICRPAVTDTVLDLLEQGVIERRELIELTFNKLQSPLRKSLEQAWLAFFERLRLSPEERSAFSSRFEDLLFAQGSAVVRSAIAQVSHNLSDADQETVERVGLLLAGLLGHPVQAVGKEAWRALRSALKQHPGLSSEIGPAVVRAVFGPHKALRKPLAGWLAKQRPESLSAETSAELKRLLAEHVGELAPELHDRLADLLPAGSEPHTSAPSAQDSDRALEHLQAAIATAATQTAVDQQRVSALRAYADGDPEAARRADARYPDDFQDGPPFEPFDTAEQMARALMAGSDEQNDIMLIERVFDGMARFRVEGDEAAHLIRLLDPVLQDGDSVPLPVDWICHFWLGTQEPENPTVPRWMQRTRALQARLADGVLDTLPAIPTQANGGIAPETFVERYAHTAEHHVAMAELEAALYRLGTTPERRRRAWQRLMELRPDFEQKPSPNDAMVIICLGPDELARSTARRLLAARDVAAQTLDDPDRLLLAAIRGRHGLGDVGPWVGEHGEAWMRSSLTAGRQASPGPRDEPMAVIEDRFIHPRPYTEARELFQAREVSFDEQSRHPHLFTDWLVASPWGDFLDRSVDFPPSAQRIFEAGVLRIDETMEHRGGNTYSRTSISPGMLEHGRHAQINIAPHIFNVTRLLACRFPKTRERIIALILGWLDDGRLMPSVLADALKDRIRETTKGMKYVDEALASISAASPAAARTVQLALEGLVLDGLAALKPKSRSMVLQRLAAVLLDSGQGVRGPEVAKALEELGRGKSAAAESARAVLRIDGARSSIPLEIEALALLLSPA